METHVEEEKKESSFEGKATKNDFSHTTGCSELSKDVTRTQMEEYFNRISESEGASCIIDLEAGEAIYSQDEMAREI